MAIPSYFKRLFREYVTGVGSSEVADQSPVQSVNSKTGDVTISSSAVEDVALVAGGDTKTVSSTSINLASAMEVNGELEVESGVTYAVGGAITGTGDLTGEGEIVSV